MNEYLNSFDLEDYEEVQHELNSITLEHVTANSKSNVYNTRAAVLQLSQEN